MLYGWVAGWIRGEKDYENTQCAIRKDYAAEERAGSVENAWISKEQRTEESKILAGMEKEQVEEEQLERELRKSEFDLEPVYHLLEDFVFLRAVQDNYFAEWVDVMLQVSWPS